MANVKHFKASNFPELGHNTAEKLPPKELHGKTGLGWLKTLRPLPHLSETPLGNSYGLLSAMGSDLPLFPGSKVEYEVNDVIRT